MIYTETYRDLCHGTDIESAENIIDVGFELRGDQTSWCGAGVYFYNIKKKAWWAAKRHCGLIKSESGKKVKPIVLFADILNLGDNRIFDLRISNDLCDFETFIQPILSKYKMKIEDINEDDRLIELRAMLIDFYSEKNKKQLVVGNFRQRPQPDHEHAINFADSLDMVFGIETIFCVKDTSIISNIRMGG